MMLITVHAAALIGLPLLTALAVICSPRKPRVRDWLLLPALPLTIGLLTGELIPCLCHRPHAISQVLIPASCMAGAIAFVRRKLFRTGLAIVSFLGVLALWGQHAVLVDSGRYTNPTYARYDGRFLAMLALRDAKQDLQSTCRANRTIYPSGWLRDIPLPVTVPLLTAATGIREWQTWITGLWRCEDRPIDIWYPGGVPAEAVESLTLRWKAE